MCHHVLREVALDAAPLGTLRALELRFLLSTLVSLVSPQVTVVEVRLITACTLPLAFSRH